MATNSETNWITINGGKFPATIGEEYINTWGKWKLDEDGFKFNDSQATWQDSQYNGSFRDYVGISSDKNMLYWMEGDYGDKKSEFDFNAWADSHKDEYADYRDENGTWYLTPEAKTDLEGRAYTQWLKEQNYDVANTTPVVKIKTGRKEGTQVYYKWDDSLNAYVPYEGKVVYWDTNSGLGKALANAGGMFLGAIGMMTGNAPLAATGSALTSFGSNGNTKRKLLGAGLSSLSSNPVVGGMMSLTKGVFNSVSDMYLQGAESASGNLTSLVNQWKQENGKTASTRALTDEEQALIKQYVSNAQSSFGGLTDNDVSDLTNYAETLARLGLLTEDSVAKTNQSWSQVKEALENYKTNTSLGDGGSTSLGSVSSDWDSSAINNVLLGALGGTALLGTLGNNDMADTNLSSFLSSLVGLGADASTAYGNYKDSKTFSSLMNTWSNNAQSLVNQGQNLGNSLSNLYDKTASDNDKLFEALKEKINVPSRNEDEWKSTPYYLTATQGSQNVNDAFAKALTAADQINNTWNNLGEAKFYTQDDVNDTYRKLANSRMALADRAAALTDSRTYASNRANGVGTSTVQNEAAAENARKYMADLANIDSQAYTDALSYVTNLSKLQTDQRNAAIQEAVNALTPTITTATTDSANQLKNSQNELSSLWSADKAADLERGWLASTAALGQQGQTALLNSLIGLNNNNVTAATNLANGYANAYGNAMNGLYQALNKTSSDISSGALTSLLGSLGLGSAASYLFSGVGSLGSDLASGADFWIDSLISDGFATDSIDAATRLGDIATEANNLLDAGKTLTPAMEDALVSAGGSASTGFWSGLGNSISSGWDSISNWFSSLW